MVVKPKGLGTATLEVLIPVEGLFGQVKFRCVVSDSNGENVISNYVTVYRGVYAHLNSYDGTLGRLDMYEHLSVTASGGVEPYSYFWYCWVAGGTQELISTEKSCKVVWKSAGTTQYLKCVVMDARGKTYEVDGIIMYSDRY